MILTNLEIYNYSKSLNESFSSTEQTLPIKLSFYIQKNIKTLNNLVAEIEESKINIVKKYADIDDEGNFSVPEDRITTANNELQDLLELTQEVNLHKIQLDNIPDNIELSNAQMSALLFMIEE